MFLDLCALTQSCFPNNTPAERIYRICYLGHSGLFIFHLYSFFLTFYITLEYSSPWWKKGRQPTPIFLPGESHGQRRLVGSMGSQRGRHDWSDLVCRAVFGVTKSQTELSDRTTATELIYNVILASVIQQTVQLYIDVYLFSFVSFLFIFCCCPFFLKNFLFYCCYCSVAGSCLLLCDPMNCSPPGSSVHGDSPGKNTRVGCHAFLQEIFPTQGLNWCLLRCRHILYCLSQQGSPIS